MAGAVDGMPLVSQRQVFGGGGGGGGKLQRPWSNSQVRVTVGSVEQDLTNNVLMRGSESASAIARQGCKELTQVHVGLVAMHSL